MGFRLGPEFDHKMLGLRKPKLLNLFKTKGPLKGWNVIDHEEMNKWDEATDMTLSFTRALLVSC